MEPNIPTTPALLWRSLTDADVPAIRALAAMCFAADGGLPFEWCGRELGSALVGEVLQRVRAVGGEEVLLTVNLNNPSAIHVYRRLGFSSIGQRARYEQTLI